MVEAQTNVVALATVGDAPGTLEAIVEGRLEAVRVGMPELDRTVLGSRDDQGQRRVKDGVGDVGCMPAEGLDARLGDVVPNLNGTVVAAGYEVGLVAAVVVVDVVDTLVVGVEGEVGLVGAQRPDLDCTVEARRGECVAARGRRGGILDAALTLLPRGAHSRILGVEGEVHDVVCMPLKRLRAMAAPLVSSTLPLPHSRSRSRLLT